MIRPVLVLSALLGLAACGQGAPGDRQGEAARTPDKPKVDPARVIRGEVTAPEGQTIDGATAMACLTPYETCLKEANAPVTVENGVGRFELVVPEAGDYHVTVWKDVNGDGALNTGDLVALAHNTDDFASGQRLTPMTTM